MFPAFEVINGLYIPWLSVQMLEQTGCVKGVMLLLEAARDLELDGDTAEERRVERY